MYSSEGQLYLYEVARNSCNWADPDAAVCGCRGCGWWTSEVDTQHACPFHVGPHPDSDWTEELVARFESDAGCVNFYNWPGAGIVRVETLGMFSESNRYYKTKVARDVFRKVAASGAQRVK